MTDQPRQQTLYLLAGNGGSAAWWDDCRPHFRRLDPQPIELPGSGSNTSTRHHSLDDLADALLDQTAPGQTIFAVGVNALVVLHALLRRPGHFERSILLAPVGAFLGERRFVRAMARRPARWLIHTLLGRAPKLFRRKFTRSDWPESTWRKIADGYRSSRAFRDYFDFVRADNALDLFEWIDDRIDLVWGAADGVLGAAQAAAWDAILPRADLSVTLQPDWGHYPYLDDPEGFARWIESFEKGQIPNAHTKAGRLQLAALAGLPVPSQVAVRNAEETRAALDAFPASTRFAVRSSGAAEDHIDHSHAGRNRSFLRVPRAEVAPCVRQLIDVDRLEQAIIQEFIEPRVSGVAFARGMSHEIEYVAGHLEQLVSGTVEPLRAILTKMPAPWYRTPDPIPTEPAFDFNALADFLGRCLHAFHGRHADIEWAWDGHTFQLLQIRPVTAYPWRRCLTSANLDEILPARTSRLMEHAQRRASDSISRVYALWDPRVLRDNEPFTVVDPTDDASYINVDLFLSRFHDWGLPSRLLSDEIGGAVPTIPFHPLRFLGNLPTLLKMRSVVRSRIDDAAPRLNAFSHELDQILDNTPGEARDAAVVRWFTRYYLFVVRQNMIINACISTAAGSFLARARTVYGEQNHAEAPHRLKFESDPATPRPLASPPPLDPPPAWSPLTGALHRLGVPGLGGRYLEIREWFRDQNMRLFFRVHHALRDSEWLRPHPGERLRAGTFWQSGGDDLLRQDRGFTIHPGTATGIVGRDILVVDALEPGHFDDYRRAAAVIARTGGRLSHGATLLRELRKPSAVIPDFPTHLDGQTLTLHNGRVLTPPSATPTAPVHIPARSDTRSL